MQEYSTIYRKLNKNNCPYYTQLIECGVKGYDGHEIIWRGRAKKQDWEWFQMIIKDQPNRVIHQDNNMICIKN